MESALPPQQPQDGELLPTRPSLLARLRNREDSKAWHRGWEEFYHLYHPVIFRHALTHRLNETEAEDVVQDVVVGLARQLPNFQYDPKLCSFKTWLFRVTRNKIVDHLRKLERHSRRIAQFSTAEDSVKVLAEVPDDNMLTPYQEWELNWESNLRRAALELVKQRVKPLNMRIYLHHVVDGYSVEETVQYFRDSRVTSDAVHLAKHRVQSMVDETIERLRSGKLRS
jgi:RNA polymerase sigma factor (sigma-70 family)